MYMKQSLELGSQREIEGAENQNLDFLPQIFLLLIKNVKKKIQKKGLCFHRIVILLVLLLSMSTVRK